MRRMIFVIAIFVVFASLARLVWVESEILAEAYEIQRLRQLDGRNRNDIRRLELSIARKTSPSKMELLASARGFELGAGTRLLPRPAEMVPEAAD